MKPPSSTSSAPHPAGDPVTAPAIEWAIARDAVDQVFVCVETKLRRRRRRRLVVAGALGVFLVVGMAWWQTARIVTEHPVAVARALPRKEVLDDGTIVDLRAGAKLAVVFTAETRRVKLAGGEAHFQVARNPQRPFVVEAGGIEVRAVGTAFAVQLSAQAVEIMVTEGRVAVEKTAPTTATESVLHVHSFASVDAGNRVVIEFSRPPALVPIVGVTPAEIDERLAWRIPRLELHATPLAQALRFLNQHSGVRVVFTDPDIGKLELSGSIRADNAEPLLRLLNREFGLEADRHPDKIVLRHRH